MTDRRVTDPSSPPSGKGPLESDESNRLAPPLSSENPQIGKDCSGSGDGPARLCELQESLNRLEDVAARAREENTIRGRSRPFEMVRSS